MAKSVYLIWDNGQLEKVQNFSLPVWSEEGAEQ